MDLPDIFNEDGYIPSGFVNLKQHLQNSSEILPFNPHNMKLFVVEILHSTFTESKPMSTLICAC